MPATASEQNPQIEQGAAKVKRFLAAGWWAGVGVLIAVLFPPTYDLLQTYFNRPENPLELSLSELSESEETLVIGDGAELRLSELQKIQRVRSAVFGNNSRIVVPPNMGRWELSAAEISFGKGVVIEASGGSGIAGPDGANGATAGGDCQSGGAGSIGGNGGEGIDGVDISFEAISIVLQGDVIIRANGGDGGNGGRGGNGGNGGRGDRSDECSGGRGGNGGNGGIGGDGGNGGSFKLDYVYGIELYEEAERVETTETKVLSHFSFEAKGGKKGAGGPGGTAGRGGAGRGDGVFGGGQPAGSNGNNGDVGAEGENGETTPIPNIIRVISKM